jgi:outer membrane protein OmpU
MKAYVAYTPRANGASVPADKATGGDTKSGLEDGFDVVIDHTGLADGLRVFAGYGHINHASNDRNSWAAGATYAVGGITAGYQHSNENLDNGGTDSYVNDAYGVSFAINDDLSISYGHHESERDVLTGADVTQESDSIQLSYTMGGATIAVSESETSKAAYSATATDQEATLVSLTLAF